VTKSMPVLTPKCSPGLEQGTVPYSELTQMNLVAAKHVSSAADMAEPLAQRAAEGKVGHA
jgi:hypothetical protein